VTVRHHLLLRPHTDCARFATSLAVALILALCTHAAVVHAQTEDDTVADDPPALRVITKEIEPFVFVEDQPAQGNPVEDALSGFSIDLWQALARAADLEYEYVVVDSVTEQLDTVAAGDADVGIAAISITQAREETVDFSYSYFDSGLGILTQNRYASAPPLLVIFRPSFLFRMLGLFGALLLIIVVVGHVIWLSERRKNDDFPQEYLRGVWQGIWWAAVTVTTVGYGDKRVTGVFGRVFALMWMFAGLFIIANFTAGVTSQLTVEQIQGVINGPEDLRSKRIVTVSGSTADEWLTARRLPHRTVVEVEEAYDLLDRGTVQAVVYDYPVLLYHALHFGEGRVRVVGSPFNDEDYGIALAEGSDLREELNRALLEVREDGTYDLIYARWFGE
jgi:polar amino acid transport system substrate-binding protein